MNIGIIGAGIMGRALAALAVKNGHAVMLSNSRHPRTLNSTAIAIGCKVGTASEAAAFGDVVMVAIPFAAYQEIPAAPLVGKVVLDANHPLCGMALKFVGTVVGVRPATPSEVENGSADDPGSVVMRVMP